MNYIQSTTFGGGGVDLKTKSTASEIFIGATFSTTGKTATSAKNAGGLDTGNEHGQFRLLYDIQLKVIQKLVTSNSDDHIKVTVYESPDNSTFTEGASYTTTLEKLNKARRTPLSFPLYSSAARYLVLGIKFLKGTAASTGTVTTGVIVATANPTSY